VPVVTEDQTPHNESEAPDQDETPDQPEALAPAADLALRAAVLELEQNAASVGWDQPSRLFALVPTAELVANEPALAEVLGFEPGADLTGSLTPVEQDDLPPEASLEELLLQMAWPDEVHGTAVIVERLVLPPSVGDLPDDPSAAQELAATHPEREEVRMVAGATRSGSTYCALRLRSHDDDFAVIEGADLVPALLQLLQGTLVPVEAGEQ
jgi:hypothetical protein